jgi:hypothetical protein
MDIYGKQRIYIKLHILGEVLTVAIVEPLQEIKNDNAISENNVISYYY